MTEQLLTTLLLMVPITGGVLAAAMPGWRYAKITGTAAFLGVVGVWLAYLQAGAVEAPVNLRIGGWLTIPSADSLIVQLSFQVNRPQVLLALVASITVLLESLPSAALIGQTKSHSFTVSVLLPLSVLAIFADDLVVLLIVWIIIDCCVHHSCRPGGPLTRSQQSSAGTESVLSVSSILLVLAIIMVTARLGTTSLVEAIDRSIQDDRIDAAAVVSGMTVLFVVAAAVRCAFFPALIWPRNCLRQQPHLSSCIVTLAGVLPGLSLAIGVLPIREVSAEGCQLLAMLGALTCLTATSVALVQQRPEGITTLLIISAAGLSTVVMGIDHPVAGEIAAAAVFAQVAAACVLKQSVVQPVNRLVSGVALAIAVSGIGGSNAILMLIEAALHNATDTFSPAVQSPVRVLHLWWWSVVVSQILWGMAIMRLTVARTDAAELNRFVDQNSGTARQPAWHATFNIFAVVLALGVCILPLSSTAHSGIVSPVRLLSFGAATPACLLGAVIYWLESQANERVQHRIAAAFNSLSRLCSEWFYLEGYIRYGIALPVRIAAIIAETIDQKILGGTSEDSWKLTASRLADAVGQQQRQPAIYYGLTGVLIVVGLLWSVF